LQGLISKDFLAKEFRQVLKVRSFITAQAGILSFIDGEEDPTRKPKKMECFFCPPKNSSAKMQVAIDGMFSARQKYHGQDNSCGTNRWQGSYYLGREYEDRLRELKASDLERKLELRHHAQEIMPVTMSTLQTDPVTLPLGKKRQESLPPLAGIITPRMWWT